MNSNLYVLNYNNYYNRIVKRLNTLTEYMTYSSGITIENCSFNPNDGVTATHYIKSSRKEFIGDYLLETQVNTQGQEEIKSRWFILEVRRERVGGFTLTLQRDIVADKYDAIVEAPMFVEKATVGLNDSAIFNSENMSFNEIKTKETLLKDDTESAWIALYFAQDITEDITGTVTINAGADIDLTNIAHTDWQYYNLNKKASRPNDIEVGIITCASGIGFGRRHLWVNRTNGWSVDGGQPASQIYYDVKSTVINPFERQRQLGYMRQAYYGIKNSLVNDVLTILYDEEDWLENDNIASFNNKTIAFSDGVYQCQVIKSSKEFTRNSGSNLDTLFTAIKNDVEDAFDGAAQWQFSGVGTGGGYTNVYLLKTNLTEYTVILTEIEGKGHTYSYKISGTHDRTEDVPYDIVLLPYGELSFTTATPTGHTPYPIAYANKPNVAKLVAKDIIEKNKGSNKLIDAQIVPYFPENLTGIIRPGVKGIILGSLLEGNNYDLIVDTDNKQHSFMFYAKSSSFTKSITVDCGNTNLDDQSLLTDEDKKVVIETEKLRICSPNYNGVFEFQPVKAGINDNEIEFNIDCTYMPQTPYIHVNPVFNGRLYGIDFDDARGLICGGDFSMAQSSDAWETYKAQNKNFQIAFNRQIENMEISNKIQKQNEVVSAITGTVQGAVQGAMGGALAGGGTGAMIGGVVGGTASAIGGAIDVMNNEKLRQEALDYTKDNFGYQLGNIKALPDSLVKLPAQTYNNKIYPFVEFYTCTDEEKEALRNKLKYNGMTIMRIGSIGQFLHNDYSYIKGQLIRLEDTGCDSHEVMYIASELNKGVFIK